MAPSFHHKFADGDNYVAVDFDTAITHLARVIQDFKAGNPEPLIIGDEHGGDAVVIPFEVWLDYLTLAEAEEADRRTAEQVSELIASETPEEGVPAEDFLDRIRHLRTPDKSDG
jgi:hypothetical protein